MVEDRVRSVCQPARPGGVRGRSSIVRDRRGDGGAARLRAAPPCSLHPCRHGRATRSLARNVGAARRRSPRVTPLSGTARTVAVIGGALTPALAGPAPFASCSRTHSGRQEMLRVTRFSQRSCAASCIHMMAFPVTRRRRGAPAPPERSRALTGESAELTERPQSRPKMAILRRSYGWQGPRDRQSLPESTVLEALAPGFTARVDRCRRRPVGDAPPSDDGIRPAALAAPDRSCRASICAVCCGLPRRNRHARRHHRSLVRRPRRGHAHRHRLPGWRRRSGRRRGGPPPAVPRRFLAGCRGCPPWPDRRTAFSGRRPPP